MSSLFSLFDDSIDGGGRMRRRGYRTPPTRVGDERQRLDESITNAEVTAEDTPQARAKIFVIVSSIINNYVPI